MENYLFGVHEKELTRLHQQHKAWAPETSELWVEAKFQDLSSIVDLGCGPGFTSIELAKLLGPSGTIYSLDKASYYLNYLQAEVNDRKLENIRVVEADITSLESFDHQVGGIFCRWFLAFLSEELSSILTQIYSMLKPGGIFVAMEYLTLESVTCCPPIEGFDSHTRGLIDCYLQNNGDTQVGRCLPKRLKETGFQIRLTKCVGGMASPNHRWWRWWDQMISNCEVLIERGLIEAEELHALQQEWDKLSKNPDAFIHTPILLQVIAEKV